MTNSKNALAKSPEKSNVSTTSSTACQKHSAPFYISSTLFHNKRLKQRRCKWAQTIRSSQKQQQPPLPANQANITIDLLSDDDVEEQQQTTPQPPAAQQNSQQHFVTFPSQGANITLVPLSAKSLQTALQKRKKRKRKSRPPIRHAQPTIVNYESIVLTDDSDTEMTNIQQPAQATIAATPQSTHFTSQISAVVDEEVTVSIVPRSSAAGSCVTKPSHKPLQHDPDTLFPMLPDETTVHTVIANRIYELSLTKLREGLADFADGQNKPSKNGRNKCRTNPPPSVVSPPQQAPISLKLSSDLSISLISDEDEANDANNSAQFSPEKLLQMQPQLSVVQHVQLPGQLTMTALHIPRRRKLG